LIVAFRADRKFARVLQLFVHFVADRMALPGIGGGANDEVICERRYVSQV
jgi:hypothetical protein